MGAIFLSSLEKLRKIADHAVLIHQTSSENKQILRLLGNLKFFAKISGHALPSPKRRSISFIANWVSVGRPAAVQ